MLAFTLRRLIFAVATFFGLTYTVWLLTTREGVLALHNLSFDALLPPHYLTWLTRILHGDLGFSLRAQEPVAQALREEWPISLLVIIPAFFLQQSFAIWSGLTAGTRYRSAFDRIFTSSNTILSSVPNFVLAVLAILLFADILHILPANGLVDLHVVGTEYGTPEYWVYFHSHTTTAVLDIASHLVLPVFIVAVAGLATDAQLVRLAMVEVLQEDYIRSAWSHGLPQWRVYWRHALRNVLTPLITNIGIQIPRLVFVGAIVELIFGLPGLGNLFIKAVFTPLDAHDFIAPRDYDVVSAYFVVLGSIALLSTIVTDFAYATADPRIRRTDAAPSYAPNPLVTGRPLLKLGQRTVTAGTLFTSLLVIAGLVVAGLSIRQLVVRQPSIQGTWGGTLIVANSSAASPGYMDIRVDGNGGITGTAYGCINQQFAASQIQQFQVTGDTDFNTTVHLEWQSASAAFVLDARYPTDNRTMLVQGSLSSSFGVQQIDISSLQRTPPRQIDPKTFCPAT